jgi:hypothetical protein
VHTQEREAGGALLDRCFEPAERLVRIAEARVPHGDPPRRDHALGAGGLQRLEHASPRPLTPAVRFDLIHACATT